MGGWLKTMAAEPNQVGSPHDKANADMTLAPVQVMGLGRQDRDLLCALSDAQGDRARAGRRRGRAVQGHAEEAADPRRRHLRAPGRGCRPMSAFQGDGDVTAPLVYVNYGMPADYDALERMGVSVKGKIVIAPLRRGLAGPEAKLAQDHGAVGAIIYSDPRDRRLFDDDVYPKGARARPARLPARPVPT
jgi:N-acetylated-alpha-linked acidic dipeptidase